MENAKENSSDEDDESVFEENEELTESVEIIESKKDLKVAIRMDSETRKKLIDQDLLNFFEIVLSDPMKHRQALSPTVNAIIKCFLSCVAYINGESEKKISEYKILNNKGNYFFVLFKFFKI